MTTKTHRKARKGRPVRRKLINQMLVDLVGRLKEPVETAEALLEIFVAPVADEKVVHTIVGQALHRHSEYLRQCAGFAEIISDCAHRGTDQAVRS